MNNITHSRGTSRKQGMVLFNVLMLMLIACFVVGSLLGYSTQSIYLSRKSLDTQRAFVAAEAGVDYGVMKMRDILQQYALSSTIGKSTLQYLFDEIPRPVSPDGRYEYVTPDGKSAFRIRLVDDMPKDTDKIEEGASAGLDGTLQRFSVICGALNKDTGGGAVVEQELQAVSTFVVRYGVFYEDDLEAFPGVEMSFDGRVHSNGDMYVGGALSFKDRITAVGGFKQWSKNSLKRNGDGTKVKIKNLDTSESLSVSITDDAGKNKFLESDYLDANSLWKDWMTRSTLRFGGAIKTSVHGVSNLSPPIDAGDTPHDIIERPLDEDDPKYNPVTEQQKFSTKAAIYIHINSDGSVSAKDRNGNDIDLGDPAELAVQKVTDAGETLYKKNTDVKSTNPKTGEYIFATDDEGKSKEGIYQTENTFYDWRERKTMTPADIYVDKLLEKFTTGTIYSESKDSPEDGIVFITRDPPEEVYVTIKETNTVTKTTVNIFGEATTTTSTTITAKKVKQPYDPLANEPCIRLRNASKLLEDDTLGLSLISDLPIYVEGSFNTGGKQSGTTKTAALVAGDAVTMLSSHWQDDYSSYNVEGVSGNPRTVNADGAFNGVVMTGNTTTTLDTNSSENYNGGFENIFRFMENWNGKTFTFKGSIICMWTSEVAIGPWRSTGVTTSSKRQFANVYRAPKRAWGYDPIYKSKSPPGIPRFFTVEETHWKRVDWKYLNKNY